MTKRKVSKDNDYNRKLKNIGLLFQEKRWIISNESRKTFIDDRSDHIFDNEEWISLRYLINIETGKNLPSIEMLIKLAIALEVNPVELFESIYKILYNIE